MRGKPVTKKPHSRKSSRRGPTSAHWFSQVLRTQAPRTGVWLVTSDTGVEARETLGGLTKVTGHITTAFLDVGFQSDSSNLWLGPYCSSRHSLSALRGCREERTRNFEIILSSQFTESVWLLNIPGLRHTRRLVEKVI